MVHSTLGSCRQCQCFISQATFVCILARRPVTLNEKFFTFHFFTLDLLYIHIVTYVTLDMCNSVLQYTTMHIQSIKLWQSWSSYLFGVIEQWLPYIVQYNTIQYSTMEWYHNINPMNLIKNTVGTFTWPVAFLQTVTHPPLSAPCTEICSIFLHSQVTGD